MHCRTHNWLEIFELAHETKAAAGIDEATYSLAKTAYMSKGRQMPIVNANLM